MFAGKDVSESGATERKLRNAIENRIDEKLRSATEFQFKINPIQNQTDSEKNCAERNPE
jgi:hypothetical protein